MIEKIVSNHDSYSQLDQKPTELIIVRPDAETLNSQSLPGFVGICATTGAKGIAMYLAIIPRNLSTTEPVYVLAARNDPDKKEKLVPYDPTLI